jgi:hypothetical protein
MSGRSPFTIEQRLCADDSLTLRRSVGNRDGAEFIDGESGRITIDFDGSK